MHHGPPSLILQSGLLNPNNSLSDFIIRPQMRRQKEHQARVGGLKKGDSVVTQGGLVGKVIKVDDTYVELELGKDVRVKAVKHTIADLIEPGSKPAND